MYLVEIDSVSSCALLNDETHKISIFNNLLVDFLLHNMIQLQVVLVCYYPFLTCIKGI